MTRSTPEIDQNAQQILPQQGGIGSNDGQPLIRVSPSDQIQPLLKAPLPQLKIQNATPALSSSIAEAVAAPLRFQINELEIWQKND